MRHVHGCWVTGADRVCEDGTKGCSRRHELTEAPEPCPHLMVEMEGPDDERGFCTRCGEVVPSRLRNESEKR